MAVDKVGGSGNQSMMANRMKESDQVKPPNKKKRTGEEPIVKDNLSSNQPANPKPKLNVKA